MKGKMVRYEIIMRRIIKMKTGPDCENVGTVFDGDNLREGITLEWLVSRGFIKPTTDSGGGGLHKQTKEVAAAPVQKRGRGRPKRS